MVPLRIYKSILAAVLVVSFMIPVNCFGNDDYHTKALAWLTTQQDSGSGSWGPDSVLDTATVLQTALLFPGSGIDVSAAEEYLSAQQPVLTDYLARKIMALAGAGHEVEQDVADLLLRLNSDGGFGFQAGYPNSCIDSLMALDALVMADADDDSIIQPALGYFTALQYSSGAFPYDREGPASLDVTCRALLVMHRLLPRYDLSFFISSAAGFIASQQNVDGGFGEEGSTGVETALALQALQAVGFNAQAVLEARTYLLSVQNSVDGSWNGRVRDTACVLAALHASDGMDRTNLQLYSSDISLQPQYPAVGQQVTVSCEVRNTGSIMAENIEIELYLGDPEAGGQFLDSEIIALLAAGGNADVQWTFTLSDDPGETDLYILVDPRDLIPEISIEDNVAIKSFISGTLPDLVISRIDLSTPTPQADEPFTVSATVQNLGESDSGPVVVGLYPGDPAITEALLQVALDPVCGGCSGRADFELTMPAGTYDYVVSVFADAGVVEANLDNNDKPCTLTVVSTMSPGLDLAVTQSGIVISPAYPREDEPISIAAAIRNQGDVAALDAVVEIYAVDGLQVSTLLHTFSGVDVGVGASVNLTLDGVRLEPGAYNIFVNVIASPAQQDIAPENNIASKILSVLDIQDVVDLGVDDLTFSPSVSHAGDPVFVKFRVTNHGNVGLAGITFGVYDGDPRNGGTLAIDSLQTLGYLDAGQSRYASGEFSTAGRGGEQTLYVFVDAAGAIGEVDEENNITSGAFTVVHDPGSDIAVNTSGLEFSPAHPSVDDEVQIYCTVYNLGSESISESFQVTLYSAQPQDGTQPIAVATIDNLNAHAYVTIAFTTQAALLAASQAFFVEADYQNAVVETNEYNNAVGMDIPVSAPDLSIGVDDLSIESALLLPEQPFILNAVIHNIGPIDADGVAVAVFNGSPENAQELARLDLPLIAAGSSEPVAFSISLPAGTHDLYVVIDPDGVIAESATTNNSASTTIAVGLPDEYFADLSAVSLNLDNYACDNRNLIVSGSVTAAFTNSGPDAVELPFKVVVFEDRNINNVFDQGEDAVLGSVEITDTVAAGVVINAEMQLYGSLLFAGNRLYVAVDSENSILEADENNNITHSMAGCMQGAEEEPCIDLSASHIRLDNANMPDSAEVIVRVGNGGNVDLDPGIDVALYDGNPADGAILLGTVQTTGALDAGVYEDVSFILINPTEGDYNLVAVVDDDGTGQGQLAEIDEENNSAVYPVTITYTVKTKDTAVSQGAQWLVDHQHSLGGWESFTPARTNATTLHALHISGMYLDSEFSDMYATLLQRVFETQATNGSWENSPQSTADSVLALLAVGEDSNSPAIRNAVFWLKRFLDGVGDSYSTVSTGHALWAIIEAGVSRDDPVVQKVQQWLFRNQNTDGFWGSNINEASTGWVFHYPLIGLHMASYEDDDAAQIAITKAVTWYRKQYERYKSEATSGIRYLVMLFYTGRYPEEITETVSRLAGQQSSSGGWLDIRSGSATPRKEPFYTAQAINNLYRNSETGGGADIRKAFRWLKTMLIDPPGDFPSIYDLTTTTSFALLALNSANDQGEYNESIEEALVRVVDRQLSNGNWHENLYWESNHLLYWGAGHLVRALAETELSVAGKDNAVSEAVSYLFYYQNNDGGWNSRGSYTHGGPSYVNVTSLVLLSLLSENTVLTGVQGELVKKGIEWLLQQKTGTANWSTIARTANTVKILESFLERFGESSGKYQAEIDAAASWLKQRQNPDGGWGGYESTVQTTACVLLALIQTGNQGAETARAVQWLLAVQNADGGWPILPGIASSSTNPTAFAVRALALAEYTQGPKLAISFDKDAYQPGETVTITVEAKDDTFQVEQVSGVVAEYGAENHSIAFAKVGGAFIGTHVLSAGHLAGSDVVSIEAQTFEGVSGYGSGIFTVENPTAVLADLSIAASAIMFSPELPDEGRSVLIAAQVHNIGNAASAPSSVRFLNGTQQIGTDQALTSLEPGASDIVFMQWDTYNQMGRNYIHVVVDPDQSVADVNRVNNSAMKPIDVVQRILSDLEVSDGDISFANTSPVEGEQIEVSVAVENHGAAVDGVVVHFYDGEAVPENLIAERIIHEIVPFGGSITVQANYDTAGRSGERLIIVKADAVDAIREQDETNNTGSVLLDVLANGLVLGLGLDRDSYVHAEDVLIDAEITNNFTTERTVVLDVAVFDSTGALLARPAQGRIIVLPPGTTEVLDDLVWNTGSAMAGEWSIAATVFEDNQRRAVATAAFSILADMSITAAVSSDRQVYYDHEQIVVNSQAKSYSSNYVFEDLSAVVEITGPEGQVLYTHTHDIAQLHPLVSTFWQQGWNTALNPPGLYTVILQVLQEGSLIASDTAFVTIAGSASGGRGFSATMSAEPGQVYRGQDVELAYSVSNNGNSDLDDLGLKIKAVYLETQEVAVDIDGACSFENNTCSGTGMFDTSGLACGDYLVLLGAETDGVEHNLAFAPLTIENRCPVAVAGENVLAYVGDLVQMNGSDSYDVDGDSLSYSWELAVVPEESSAELIDSDQYNPGLVIDRHGTYELRLNVSDGMCQSQSDSVLVTTQNRPPVAIAGESLLVDVGETVELNASGSYDPDNDVIEHYEWIMVSRPAGSMAALSDRFVSDPVFTADMPGVYRLQLVVRDFEYASDPVELEVNTRNRRPVADCGPDREVEVGDVVQLDSAASYDPDFDAISVRWALLSVPEGSLCTLDNATVPGPVFTADMPGAYIVQLIVSDAEFDSIPVTCTITTRNRAPIAVATADPEQVSVGTLVSLSASESSDLDGDALTFTWQFVSAPEDSAAAFDDAHALETAFVPDLPGEYLVMLSVDDGLDIDSAQIMITAIDDNPPECADDLGISADYSIFALNGITLSNAVVAGRIAAGGDVDLQNVVIGKHAEIDSPEEGVLVAGGDIDYSKGTVHSGSIIAAGSVDGVSDKVQRTLDTGATVTGYTDLPFEFDYESEYLRRLSARLAGLEPTGVIKQCKNTLTLRGDAVSDIQIFSIDMQQIERAQSLHLKDIARHMTVVINVSGEGAVENIGMAISGWLHDRVLFNFYEAYSLTFRSVALKGSVLAPYAEVTAESGVIFGNVIVDTWHGSMKVGNDDCGCDGRGCDGRGCDGRGHDDCGRDGRGHDDCGRDDRGCDGRGHDDCGRDDRGCDCQGKQGFLHVGQKPFIGLLPECDQ